MAFIVASVNLIVTCAASVHYVFGVKTPTPVGAAVECSESPENASHIEGCMRIENAGGDE